MITKRLAAAPFGVQFLLTVGTVVLGLFVASRVLGIEAGGSAARPQGKKKGGRWGSGRCVLHKDCILPSFSLACTAFWPILVHVSEFLAHKLILKCCTISAFVQGVLLVCDNMTVTRV